MPQNPSGLGPEWKDVTPDPDNQKCPRRFRNPEGVEIEFDPATPGADPSTSRGRDGWHEVDPKTGHRVKKGPTAHLNPGDPVPSPRGPGNETTKKVVRVVGVAAGVGIVGYGAYRVVRMLPSLAIPVLWPTIIPNLIVP